MSTLIKSKTVKAALGFVVALALIVSIGGAHKANAAITMNLKKGMSNSQVMELQQWLNSKGFTVSTSGTGSAGMESMYFGTKTFNAVVAFQTAANVFPHSGYVGPLTRAALASWTGTGPGPVVVSGPVSAMLSTDNPASGTLVAGQATADLAHFTFSGSGTVTNVTLQRTGVSADSTPSNVYLFDGAQRLTDAASVASNGTVTINIPAGIFNVSGSKTIKVKSDIASGTSGQTVGMMLKSYATAAGTVNANLSGNIHTIASASLASVTHGTVTPTGATINPGAAQTLWQSTLTVSTRDVWMKRLALRNVGSAPASSFQNFKLYMNGVQVATAAGMDSMGYVTFDLNAAPVLLVSGARTLRVDADVVSGASRTVHLSLRQAADVDFVDSSFGVNITPGNAGADPTPWVAAAASTISGSSGGTLSIEKDVSSPSTNLVNGGSDVNLGTFKITAFGEPMKIETLRVAYTGSANIDDDDDSLRNGRVLVNGVQYGSTASLNETTDGTLAYTSYTLNYTVYPGTPVMLEVHSDVYDDNGTNDIVAGTDTVTAVIAIGSSNVQRMDSLGTASYPAAAVSGNTLTIASTSLTLAKNNTYANQTTVLPTTNYKIGSWNLSGSSIEDVLLTTLSFDVDEVTSTEFDEGDITNMYVVVKNGGTVVAQPSPIATVSATDNNYSINYTIAKNNNLTIELFANLADDGSDSAIDAADSFKTDLTVTGTSLIGGSAVTATSADTDGQTIIFGTASITATADATTPVAAITADAQSVASAAFKFAAVTASYNITDVTLTLGSATVVNNVMLYDGGTLLQTRPGATTVTFSGLNWNIPANSNKVLTVKLDLGTVMDSSSDGTGSTAGAALLTTLTAFTATNTSTGVSDASANDAGPSIENNPAGNVMYAYAATPTITNVALPSSNITAGTNTFAKFTVAANGGSLAWEKIKFTILRATTGAAIANTFTVWDENGTQVAGTATLTDAGTADNDCGDAADTSCTVAFVATTEQGVTTSHTYTLKGTVSGTLTDGDYFATNITQPSSFAVADDYTGAAATSASFVWSDLTGNGHDIASTTVTDWNNGYLVKFLATDAQTLTRSL